MNHLGTQSLETERLLLRQFRCKDVKSMYQNCLSSAAVTKFLSFKPYPNLLEASLKIVKWVDKYPESDFYHWAIVLKSLGEPIGAVSLSRVDPLVKKATAGYYIGEAWWHQGIVAEALSAVLTFAFNQVKLNRVEARHDINNPNSGAVMKKCGMVQEGIFRQAGVSNVGVYDVVQYAILAEDYARMQTEIQKERKR